MVMRLRAIRLSITPILLLDSLPFSFRWIFYFCLLNFRDVIHELYFMIGLHERFGIRDNFVVFFQL